MHFKLTSGRRLKMLDASSFIDDYHLDWKRYMNLRRYLNEYISRNLKLIYKYFYLKSRKAKNKYV